jgi:hypothetical protein
VSAFVALGLLASWACKKEEPPPPEQETLDQGEACDPNAEPVPEGGTTGGDDPPPICAPGLSCAPVADSDEYVCGAALEIRGRVTDSTTGEPIAGALVAALNETGEPVTDVVSTDSCGDYELPVTVRRNPDGTFAETLKWTLSVSARDYQAFPSGLRPAFPVDMADAVPNPEGPEDDTEGDGDTSGDMTYTKDIIDNAATHVALIPLGAEAGGVTVAGHVGAEDQGTAGTLVVAEGAATPAPYGIADLSGAYTIFNVPTGAVTIRGYRRGVEVTPASIDVGAEDLVDVDLAVTSTDPATLGVVSGSLNIVNAPGGSVTSVVLVPASVFNVLLERGPVPLALRDPPPPAVPDVSGAFTIDGVPSGTYKVLVAFENDFLVRDPDTGIAGTVIQEVTLDVGQMVTVADAFKVTEALAITGPGNEAPEAVEAMPTLIWADDSSEDGYDVIVFDALGNIVWETEVAGVSGSETVELPYGGPALVAGMYYQFRVTAWRDVQGEKLNTSRTEDLRGVFVHGEAPPVEECVAEEGTGGADSTGTG